MRRPVAGGHLRVFGWDGSIWVDFFWIREQKICCNACEVDNLLLEMSNCGGLERSKSPMKSGVERVFANFLANLKIFQGPGKEPA